MDPSKRYHPSQPLPPTQGWFGPPYDRPTDAQVPQPFPTHYEQPPANLYSAQWQPQFDSHHAHAPVTNSPYAPGPGYTPVVPPMNPPPLFPAHQQMNARYPHASQQQQPQASDQAWAAHGGVPLAVRAQAQTSQPQYPYVRSPAEHAAYPPTAPNLQRSVSGQTQYVGVHTAVPPTAVHATQQVYYPLNAAGGVNEYFQQIPNMSGNDSRIPPNLGGNSPGLDTRQRSVQGYHAHNVPIPGIVQRQSSAGQWMPGTQASSAPFHHAYGRQEHPPHPNHPPPSSVMPSVFPSGVRAAAPPTATHESKAWVAASTAAQPPADTSNTLTGSHWETVIGVSEEHRTAQSQAQIVTSMVSTATPAAQPWIAKAPGQLPSSPAPLNNSWTARFPLGNVLVTPVVDARFAPASLSLTGDSGDGRKKNGKSRPCFVTWHHVGEARSNMAGPGIYVAPLLTSNHDPGKLQAQAAKKPGSGGTNTLYANIPDDLRELSWQKKEWWLPVRWILAAKQDAQAGQGQTPFKVPDDPAHPSDGRHGSGPRERIEILCYSEHRRLRYTMSFIWAADPGHYIDKQESIRFPLLNEQYCHLPRKGREQLQMKWGIINLPNPLGPPA